MSNLDVKKHRKVLFGCLGEVLKVSREKFNKNKKSDAARRSWGRLICQTVKTYGSLLETVQLEELNERVEALEAKIPGK